MDERPNDKTRLWYENSYGHLAFKAQRQYPNEELLRFLGRNFFALPYQERKGVKILEVGCGSCSNLWMIAREGFDAYGIDISEKSIELGKLMLEKWNTTAEISVQDMTSLSFKNAFFDVIVDIFSSYCLDKKNFASFLQEANRVLKLGGKIFLYTPSDKSEAFTNHHPAVKIDENTLNGIHRAGSPFYGNAYPFRFESIERLKEVFLENGFECTSFEFITRTYKNGEELFEHISCEAIKRVETA